MLNLDIPDTEIYTLADPGLDGLIRECQDQPVITFDTETSGLDITRDMPLFWSVAFGERKICLTADTLPAFARVFGDDDKTFVGHNIKYDIHMLANRGIRVRGRWRDTSVMHALLFENEQHALKTVTKKLLGWGWSSFNETFKTKKRKVKGNQKFFIQQASAGMKHLMEETGQEPVELHVGEDSTLTKEALLWYWQHDPSALADYASNDAYGTMKLDQALQELLAKEAIFSAYPDVYSNMLELYIDTEMPFTQVLWGCERRGIFVDQEYLAKTEAPVVARLAEIERQFSDAGPKR
jgi:DNA polymerase I-like protein with 3'-5' exonuclease and polymerase domains